MEVANSLNCVAFTHPEFASLFWNREEALSNKFSSSKRVDFKCPNCNNLIQDKIVWNIFKDGLFCYRCSDGVSYPEKIVINLLDQMNIDYKYQKTFNWSKNRRYDFYIPLLNCIIETHGRQHYEQSGFKRTLEEEQHNDRLKETLAKENGIKYYIIIDCRKSKLEWIKGHITQSEVNQLFDLSNIDWLKCHEFACSTFVKEACELWSKGMKISDISNKLKVAKGTVSIYLKRGNILKWADYDPKEEMRKNGKSQGNVNGQEIVQLSLNGEFLREWKSSREASRELNINFKSVSDACYKKMKTYKKNVWMFKEEYDKLSIKQLKEIIESANSNKIFKRKVIQLSLGGNYIKTWDSISDAQKTLNINHISSVCSGKRGKSGGYKWIYKEDYIKERCDSKCV